MSSVDSIVKEIMVNITRPPEELEAISTWIQGILADSEIIAYYISRNPDFKYSENSEILLAVLSKKGIHGIDIKSVGPNIHNYTPLNQINLIQSFQPEDTKSYVVILWVSRTNIAISDFIEQKEELQDFTKKIIQLIEEID